MGGFLDKIGKFWSDFLYKHLKFDQARDYVMRLSERDRKIVIGSGIALIVFVMLFTYYLIDLSLDNKESKIENSIKNFDKIIELREEYRSSVLILKKIEETIKNSPGNFTLGSHLEKIADRKGVKIDSLGKPRDIPNEFYKETQVEVKINQVSLKTLVQFLHDVESSQNFLKITSIRIRPNYTKPEYLDLVFSVSTFSPK